MSDNDVRDEQAQQAMQQAQEKLIPQSKVNELIQTAKMSEREKAEALLEQQKQMMATQQQAMGAGAGMDQRAAPEIDVNDIANQAYERLKQEQQARDAALEEENMKKHYESLASRFYSKMNEGAAQFDDFQDVMKNFDYSKFPEIVEFVTDLPNTAAVMRELRKNTNLLSTINSLSKVAPELAKDDLMKLSDSINMNDKAFEASRNDRTEPPLDSVNPSRVTNSSGKRSFSDMRYDDKYRV
jgi:hypothetical protein